MKYVDAKPSHNPNFKYPSSAMLHKWRYVVLYDLRCFSSMRDKTWFTLNALDGVSTLLSFSTVKILKLNFVIDIHFSFSLVI